MTCLLGTVLGTVSDSKQSITVSSVLNSMEGCAMECYADRGKGRKVKGHQSGRLIEQLRY